MIALIFLVLSLFFFVGFMSNIFVIAVAVLCTPYLLWLAHKIKIKQRKQWTATHPNPDRTAEDGINNRYGLPMLNAKGFDDHGIPILGSEDDGLSVEDNEHDGCNCSDHQKQMSS